ncbi:dense granular protein GRA10 [Besnoitia besnoiti]|uniref:Dense granular protein GRA10 n=1 Tax=Besnoitia besnoiti TaxID=94643 RepID=A0A2A9MED8_BESBE|nr:dense granular protein GRA10 [Besnoitia besnoiti]PFH35564.1 dense granular protein GRA10 [Besnoitia besnoiti]
MLLYYRLSSEHAGSYRQCPLSCSALSLSEVKQLLAARCGLANEYGRKIDFRIFLAGSSQASSGPSGGASKGDEELTEVTDENQMIHAYSKVVVQRVAIIFGGNTQSLLHIARSGLSKEECKTAEERKLGGRLKRLPPEWLCGLCQRVMTHPVLVKCTSNCAQSACQACLESQLGPNRLCPFCNSPFRQAIRNKRLEEIIVAANLSEFEPAPGLSAGTGPSQAVKRSAEGGAGGRGYRLGAGEEPSTESHVGSSGGASAAFRGANLASEEPQEATTGDSRGVGGGHAAGACQQPFQEEADWLHFVYLIPQENLKLMRQYDMMVIEDASNLAVALASKAESGRKAKSDGLTATPQPLPASAERPEDSAQETSKNVSSERDGSVDAASLLAEPDVCVVPLCSSGGGTSFSIGGFARIQSASRVDAEADSAAAAVVQQWQSASSSHSPGVYRVTWENKFNPMPMLPSRKQPLCNLLGVSRRQFGTGGAAAAGSVQGLLRREAFGSGSAGVVEAVVEASKYEEVLTCIKDYAQFGSRPAEPWQYSTPAAASATAKKGLSTAGGAGADAARVPPPPPPPPPPLPSSGAPGTAPSRRATGDGRSTAAPLWAGVAPASAGSALISSDPSAPPPASGEAKATGTERPFGIPVSLGPPFLGLRGEPGDSSNPFLGYCALLPLLTEEQFRYIRRLQKRAMDVCGYATRAPTATKKKRRVVKKKGKEKDAQSRQCTEAGTLNSASEPREAQDHTAAAEGEESQEANNSCEGAGTNDRHSKAQPNESEAHDTRHPLSDIDPPEAARPRIPVRKPRPRVPPPLLKASLTSDGTDTEASAKKVGVSKLNQSGENVWYARRNAEKY